jgi:hypothetical protein
MASTVTTRPPRTTISNLVLYNERVTSHSTCTFISRGSHFDTTAVIHVLVIFVTRFFENRPCLSSGWILTANTPVQSWVIAVDKEIGYWSMIFKFFDFSLLIIIQPPLHTHPSPQQKVCDRPVQVTHYHTLRPKLGALSLTRHLAGLVTNVVYFVRKEQCI